MMARCPAVHTCRAFAVTDLPHVLISSLERAPWGWSLLAVVILALIKVWPIIQLQTLNAKQALRGEKRDELHNCQERLDAMDKTLDAMRTQMHQLDMKLVGTVSAYRILHDHVTISDPENPALMQARTVYKTTWDGFLPSAALAPLT